MSLRVAYMTGEYPRVTDTFIQREVAALRQRDVHVQTLSIRKPSNKETVSPDVSAERARTLYVLPTGLFQLLGAHCGMLLGAPLRYLRAFKTALLVRPPGLKALARQFAYFAESAIVAKKVRDEKLQHLHNHFSNSSCSVAMLAAEMGGFTFSFTMHGPAEFFEPHYWRIDEKIRRALFVNTISNFCRSQAMIFSPIDKWNRLHIVHCGVNPSDFARVRHVGPGKRLLFVGRLAGVKGVPVLLDAFALILALHPDATLTLAGDGPDRAPLEAQAEQLQIAQAVKFVGYQSQQQVRELLQQTDVFVMASFAEGVPVVLMEAMAAGVPVVATRVAGISELVEGGVSGFQVPPGDAKTLAKRVTELMAHPDMRDRFGAAGRAKVAREFNIETEAAWLCEILTEALDGRVAVVRKELATDTATTTAPTVSPSLAGVGDGL